MWSHRRRPDEDFQREIDSHIALEADRLIAEGMNPDEARVVARRRFGNVTRAREQHFESSRLVWLDHLRGDLRYAWRSMRRQPALACAVIFTVAVAVAGNAAVFAVFDGLLFRPLPYPEADRIVALRMKDLPGDQFGAERQRLVGLTTSGLFSDWAYASGNGSGCSTLEEGAEAINEWGLRCAAVSASLFDILGIQPLAGRLLTPEDWGVSRPQPVMIAYDLWKRLFEGDPSIIDQIINLPGTREGWPVRVVGVMPAGFDFPSGSKIWIAFNSLSTVLPNYARLAPGVTIAQARRVFPSLTILPLREAVRPRDAAAAGVLLAAALLMLLVAWVQVVALLSSRAAARVSEFGVRLALGATRWRIGQQFTVEGLVITAVALALAWVAAPGLTALIVRVLPTETTVGQTVTVGYRTFAFTSVLSLISILVVPLASFGALRHSSPLSLVRGSFLKTVGAHAVRMRTSLVVGQVTLTAITLYMAGLAFHSFATISRADLGFAPEHVISVMLPSAGRSPTGSGVEGIYQQRDKFNEVIQTLNTLPGVIASGAGARVPLIWRACCALRGIGITSSLNPGGERMYVRYTYVTPGYEQVLGLRIREGRAPTRDESVFSVLVNETLARQLAHFGPVLGQSLRTTAGSNLVIGVVDDVVILRPDEEREPEIFGFINRTAGNSMKALVAKVEGSGDATIPAIRAMMQRLLPEYPAQEIVRLEDEAARAVSDQRARSTVLSLLGLLCVPLAAAGVSGALLHETRQRSREIGIRLALGANARDIQRRVVGRALATVSGGLALGLIGGLGIGRWMSSYLYGISSIDPLSMISVVAVLMGVAGVSAAWPARTASRIDLSAVLRDA